MRCNPFFQRPRRLWITIRLRDFCREAVPDMGIRAGKQQCGDHIRFTASRRNLQGLIVSAMDVDSRFQQAADDAVASARSGFVECFFRAFDGAL
jgi:hypothetical protein